MPIVRRLLRGSLFFVAVVAIVAGTSETAAAQGAERCEGGSPAEAAVCGLYETYLEVRPAGLPTQRQQRAFAPYLSRRLLALMDEARREQKDFARRFPDEKPPFVDGCLFASLFEGPDRFELVSTDPKQDGTTRVTVRFGYQDAKPWEDTIVVAREGKRLVVDDVLFGGAGEFNPPGSLAEGLAARDQ